MDTSKLLEIEAIKKLKARYFRTLDKKLWEELGEVFTEDATLRFGDNPDDQWNGRENIVKNLSAMLADATTVHHGHMPEIEFTGEQTATGIWSMFDYVQMPDIILKGYGHYEEEYVKDGDTWRIKYLRLTRIRVDTCEASDENPGQ